MLLGIFTGHLKTLLAGSEIWYLIEKLPLGITWTYAFEGLVGTISSTIGLYLL